MKHFFHKLYHQWKELLKERKFRISLLIGIGLLLFAYWFNYQASLYTQEIKVLTVGDLILDNIPTVNLGFIYLFGILLTEVIFYLYPIFFRPDLGPFTAKTVATFFIIRSIFITLTHLGAPEGFYNLPQLADQYGISRYFYINDLFFSGHTGFPFLGALLFWNNKFLRYFLLAMSGTQAITVLFMHVHYSIDVFSAYFITYTIYAVSDKVFNKLNRSFLKIIERLELRMKLRLPH